LHGYAKPVHAAGNGSTTQRHLEELDQAAFVFFWLIEHGIDMPTAFDNPALDVSRTGSLCPSQQVRSILHAQAAVCGAVRDEYGSVARGGDRQPPAVAIASSGLFKPMSSPAITLPIIRAEGAKKVGRL